MRRDQDGRMKNKNKNKNAMVISHPRPRVLSLRAPVFGEIAADAIDVASASQTLALEISESLAASVKASPKTPQQKRRGSFTAATCSAAACAAATPLPSFLAAVRKELPSTGEVLVALQSIGHNVESASSNRNELVALRDRCSYLTACVIVKCRGSSNNVDVSPLVDRVNEVEDLVRRCCGRGRVGMAMRASVDKRDVAELHDRLNELTLSMGLTGIVAVEERLDDLKELLSMMKEKRPALTDMTPKNITTKSSSVKKRSSVPKGTPARQCWHVTRDCVIKRVVKIVIEGIRGRDGSGGVGVGGHEGRRVVGLVGESGSGTTTAASELVRRSVVRELFPDGIVWLNVGNGAKGRLRCLMHDLASMVHEVVGGGKGKPPPADSFSCEGYSSAAYIKEMVTTTAAVATKGQGHGHRRCLLVADDVWDAEVISELRATGMWILVTTHREDLIKGAKGETVRVEKLSQDDAEAVLRRASGIPAGMHLPEAARDLSELCGYVAMDVAFVGRWNTVCGRGDRLAWSDAAASIRMELDAQNYDDAVTTTGGGAPRMKLRAAVLRAGFDELSAEGYLVQWLYMALAVMPDAHAFSVMDAAALLYDSECEIDDLEPIKSVVDTLERWSILRADGSPSAVLDMTQGWWRTHKYRMHAAHCMFARENLVDRVDVLGPAVRRWVRHISSPEAVHEISPIVLVELWRAVKCVAGGGGGGGSGEGGGESGCRVVDIDPSCGSYTSGGDGDGGGGWGGVEKADSAEVIKKWGAGGVQHELLHLHPEKMIVHGQQPKRASSSSNNKTNNNTICSLAVQSALRATQFHLDRDDWDCAFAMWTRALDWMHTEKSDTDEAVTPTTSSATAELVFEKLVELGWCVWVAGREEEAVELVNRGAVMGEAKLGPGAVNDVLMSKGSPRLGAKFCGRHEQSSGGRRREALLTRVLEIRVVKPLSSPPPPLTKLMPETGAQTVSTTLHQLACGVWDNGRCEEGISLLRRALEMVEGNRVMMATTAGWEKGEVKDEGFSSNVVKMRQQLDRWIQETEGTE